MRCDKVDVKTIEKLNFFNKNQKLTMTQKECFTVDLGAKRLELVLR